MVVQKAGVGTPRGACSQVGAGIVIAAMHTRLVPQRGAAHDVVLLLDEKHPIHATRGKMKCDAAAEIAGTDDYGVPAPAGME